VDGSSISNQSLGTWNPQVWRALRQPSKV